MGGKTIPGISKARRYIGWRLLDAAGCAASRAARLESAIERLLCNPAIEKAALLRIMNRQYTIATLGSHSALQILKGAHDEGFKTLAIANRETERLYRSFAFVDEVIGVDKYSDFMGMLDELQQRKVIIVPHGSFVAYLSLEEHKKMTVPYFGNKAVLDWEASRELQREWLSRANLTLPRQFKSGAEIDRPVIVKLYGAAGGKGYMFIRDTRGLRGARHASQGSLHHPRIHHRRPALHPLLLFAADEAARDHVDGPPLRDERRFARAASRRPRKKAWTSARPTSWSAISRCRCASRCWPKPCAWATTSSR